MPFKSPYNKMISDKVNQINKNMIDTHHQVESFTPQNPDNSENGNYYNLGISPNTEAIAGSGRKVGGSLYSRAKSAASKVYNVGKKVYDTGKYIYDEAGNLYKKPVSRGLHLASKVAEHYGYGKKCGKGLPNYPMSSGELGMMGNGKIADYMQLGSNLAGYTPIPYLDKALGIGSTVARFAGLGRSGGTLKRSRACGSGSSGGRRKGAGTFSNIAHGVGDVAGAFGLGHSGAGYSGGGPFGGIAHGVGDVLGAFGLGKKKRKVGGMKISDALKLAGMVNPAMSVAGNLAGAFGLGKKKGKGTCFSGEEPPESKEREVKDNRDAMNRLVRGASESTAHNVELQRRALREQMERDRAEHEAYRGTDQWRLGRTDRMRQERDALRERERRAVIEARESEIREARERQAVRDAARERRAALAAAREAARDAEDERRRVKGGSHPEEYAMVDKHTSRGSTASGFGKPKRVNKRAEIVKKVMREHGISMIDASKYVKAHNMY